jgi:uncharacterized membrane protein
MRRRFCTVLLSFTCVGAAGPAAADPRFDVIEPLPGAGTSDALGVSGDGCRVVGHSDFEAFSWQDGDTSPLPAPNPQIAYAVTPDGRVVVGYAGHDFFRMDETGLERIHVPGGAGNPTEARAVSADGQSAGGCTHATEVGMHCDWPFFWNSGTGSTLLPGVSGSREVGSVEAISADGAVAAGAAGGRAVVWQLGAGGTVQDLGALPGHTQGEVRDLTPDGAIAVGRSGPASHSGARAFRWTAATGMVELGSDARVAHAVSADGQRIVGEGPLGAFLWEPAHGVRLLADVLRDDYGLDLGGFELGSATAVSPDGQTIVGSGGVPGGSRRGWRARLHEEPCPQPPLAPPVDLLEYAPLTVEEPTSLRIDALGRLSVSGIASRNVVRLDTDLASHGNPVVETLLDFSPDPLPHPNAWDVPIVLATGTDGSVYVGAALRRQLIRVGSDGAVHVAFDGSAHPPLGDEFFPVFTAPTDAKLGPDGSLYVAADARVVRIDPDGSVHELIDAVAAQEAGYGWSGPLDRGLYWVEVDAQGRVFVTGGSFVLVLDRDGNVLETVDRSESEPAQLRGMEVDARGALWLYGDASLSRRDPDGTLEDIFLWDIPDGAGGTFTWGIRDLVVDGASNVYYTNGDAIVRRTPEGVLTRVLGPETLDIHGLEVGPLGVLDMTISGNLLFAADYGRDRIFRVELPPLPAACENGFDDDGDGVVDFGADPGCTSANDDGEREASLSCDNGLDDDADGIVDYPADTSCASHVDTELPECNDGLDNDGDGAVDWNGTPDFPADPECGGDPMRVIEHPWYCGLGFEVALLLPLYTTLRRWKRKF